MTPIWILLGLILVLAVLVFGMSRVYRNQKIPHQTTPAAFGISFQEVRFPTRGERQLYGWWIPAQNAGSGVAPTIILVHGWSRNVERMLPYIRHLHPNGYNLLAFDSRNHGSSDADDHSSLLKFAEDIRAAIDFVEKQDRVDPARIGVIGVSLGGAAAIYAAAQDARITYLVTIGAFAHPAKLMRLEFQKRHIPYFPLVALLFKYIQFRIGAKFDQIAPVNNIQKVQASIFLIHGSRDTVVPLENGEALQRAGTPAKTRFWEVPEKGHSDCHTHPDFWQKVDAFLAEVFEVSRAKI